MNSDVLLIVLTENSWLYAGLTALLPEMNCVPPRDLLIDGRPAA